MKLQYDFETLKPSNLLIDTLKKSLNEISKRSIIRKGIGSNSSLCIAYLAIQYQWPNFIEEIIKEYSDSLENVTISFKILKNLSEECMTDDIVIDEWSKNILFKKLENDGEKILRFLNIWARNINENKICEGTELVSKWKFVNGVLYMIHIAFEMHERLVEV